ncbi:transporter [Microbacterium sorbitolivorans]|uniref:Cation diffusion facilitator family transporter n=1 Tax=Microbacterium sorbitolivorans TaxID=1867410 RepID=A0A367XY87_9MICO|nr:cation diffusion facilitator family transporter [Microbacterium sorbitolivorans]RCK58587.1 cation diffusion facilitator family transporter [Microbacterium sorbitolivorans]GGF37743.1 transporter [Microbacterium sorbitolivorans]
MSAHGGGKAILAAFLANMGIALAKLIGWLLSGSASMLAEAVHSIADSSNQVLLFVGGKTSRRHADRQHPFGYGRDRYVYAFVVGIILFSVGGLFSVYEGVEKLTHPHELSEDWWWLPIVILVIAIVLEGFSLRTAIGEANEVRPEGQSWWQFIRRSRSPELPVLLLEDTAALIGLVLALSGVTASVMTGDPVYDALGTLAIGILLILVAIVVGVEMKSLLVGEGATNEQLDDIIRAIEAGEDVEKLIHIKTLYLGPDELLVAAKIGVPVDKPLGVVARDIDEIEERIRAAVPQARVIYLEPDVYRRAEGDKPPTEAFVFPSSD